jgi:hypothetical protein
MRTFQLVLGWVFVAFAVIFIAVVIDDANQHKAENPGVSLALAAIFGGGGALIIRAARRSGKPDAASRATTVIRAAQKRGGRITAAEVVADTSIAFEDAKLELDKLHKAGACEVVVGDAGILVYRFPEFEDAANKNDVV